MKHPGFPCSQCDCGEVLPRPDMKIRGDEEKEEGSEETEDIERKRKEEDWEKKKKKKEMTRIRLCAFKAEVVNVSPNCLRKSSKSFPRFVSPHARWPRAFLLIWHTAYSLKQSLWQSRPTRALA